MQIYIEKRSILIIVSLLVPQEKTFLGKFDSISFWF